MKYMSNMYVNDIVVAIYYKSEKERIAMIKNIEKQMEKDRTIRGIEVDDKKSCISYVYGNDFRNFH